MRKWFEFSYAAGKRSESRPRDGRAGDSCGEILLPSSCPCSDPLCWGLGLFSFMSATLLIRPLPRNLTFFGGVNYTNRSNSGGGLVMAGDIDDWGQVNPCNC